MRTELWTADMIDRFCWFRVMLHLVLTMRRWRNRRWHWQHILEEFHATRTRK